MSNLVKRSIESVGWNISVSIIQIPVGFARSLILARFLDVKTFGIYAFAGSIITLSAIAANFGMGGAFLHRSEESRGEERAAALHFTLKLIFTMVWIALLSMGALIFVEGQRRLALLVMIVTQGGVHLCQTPNLILVRRVVHRRLALLQSINIILSAITAALLAWRGIELWALLSTDIITLVLTVFFLYVWRPVWRPRLAWDTPSMGYFLRYGSRNVMAQTLLRALDRVDDLWTGVYLGNTEMGYYSRSYAFATYPRMLLAQSVNKVATGTYAEVADKRKRLSRAFFRTNAFLVRSGFFLAGLLALIAPEFINLLLGAKWIPMLDAFRLMLIFTMFDPIKVTVANLFLAVGKPGELIRVRAIQLVVMLIGLFTLGSHWGIAGVALSVDVMLVVGIVLLLRQARAFVDISVKRLFGVPALALFISMALGRGVIELPGLISSYWWTGFAKATVFSIVYAGMLLVLERHETMQMVRLITGYMKKASESTSDRLLDG